jgi:type II secretory pathway pseudopilin PulG
MASKRAALTLIELLIVIVIIGSLLLLLLPAIQAAREAARTVQCKNHLRQIGLGLHQYHHSHDRLPSGWIGQGPQLPPGWGWATLSLPYLEIQHEVAEPAHWPPVYGINHPRAEAQRLRSIPIFLCPSDPSPLTFTLHMAPEAALANAPNSPGPPLFQVARANYAGVFGTQGVERAPGNGDGVFFHNSDVRFDDVRDGLSHTLFVGERSSRLDKSMWIGSVPGAHLAMVRIVGTVERVPNDVLGHFSEFSSYHSSGAHFLVGDGGVRLISDEIDLHVYRGMATRAGGEVVQWNGARTATTALLATPAAAW